MRSRATKRAVNATALHWTTHFMHVHGFIPNRINAEDRETLREIVAVQCFGDESRACDMIERIIRAPLHYASLTDRYVEFWAWLERGSPKRRVNFTTALLNSCLQCIRRNLAGAA